MSTQNKFVYVFNGEGAAFPAAIFTELESATKWIEKYSLTGVLSKMPVDISVYDWAISKNYFVIKNEGHTKPSFVQRFSTASVEHWHFEDGVLKN